MQNIKQLYQQKLIADREYPTWLAFTVVQMKTPSLGGPQWNGS
jgi:hypothetical protein